ncbi:hypothetical protein [Burkholderia ambifaria]|uniref:hypothetical protein n=1 Tax=Burkholderia ambifaria TaxID=152480 RepID=UPI00158D3F4F|nr:hypothetical protein [Burkholderia ambifaria]
MPVGLRKEVRLLHDFGYVYLDDGARVFKLTDKAFDSMRSDCVQAPLQILRRYPNLFVTVRSRDEAERRFSAAEVR